MLIIIRTCEGAINKLEAVDDITDKYNIEFVKVNNKKYARSLGIREENIIIIIINIIIIIIIMTSLE